MITGLYAGILAFLYFGLSFNVIFKRRQFKVGIGDGDNHVLKKAIRVHSNFAEYVPFVILLMMLCEFTIIETRYIHIAGGTLVFARLLHAYGLTKTSVASFERVIGALLTFIVMLGLAGYLVMQYVTA